MTEQEQESMRDLLRRAGVSADTISECRSESDLCLAMDVADDLRGGVAPDKNWFSDWFKITGDHMVLTDEGWIPADSINDGDDPVEIMAEVNAPAPG